jgi:MFS family permease
MGWWIGSTVSSLGTSLSTIAFPLLMLYETGSVVKAGVIGAAQNAARLLTMLIGGVLADRVSRRVLLTVPPLVQAAAVGSVVPLVLTHHVSVYTLAAVAIVHGLSGGLGSGALRPSLKRIVPAEQFPQVAATQQGRDGAADLIGPPIGGFLFAIARWAPFLGDAISFLAAALGVALVRTQLGPDKRDEGDGKPEPMHRQMAEGYRFVRSNAYMRFITAWAALINGLFTALMLLVIALIRYRGGGPVAIGSVNSIASLGVLVGAAFSPWLMRKVAGRTLTVIASWLVAAGIFAIAWLPGTWEIGAVFAVVLLLVPPLNTVFETYEMKIIPDELYGRVSALMGFLASALMWIGPVLAGWLADVFSTVTAVAVVGGALAVLAVWVQATRALDELDADRSDRTGRLEEAPERESPAIS